MKRILSVVCIFALMISILSGCSSNTRITSGGDGETKGSTTEKIKVALVSDTGGINDKSINQATHTGMVKATEEFGMELKVLESKSPDEYEANLETLSAYGSNMVIGIGGNMVSAVENVADRFKDVNFAILDASSDRVNVKGVVFKEHEGSFLAGIVAGLMTKTNNVGFLGGMDIEVINRFEAGYAAGVMCVNPEAGRNLVGDAKVPGSNIKFAESFSDSNRGYELSKSLYAEGCDVIYHAAGPVGIGLFMSAMDASKNGEKVWAIGVDQDQAVALPEYADYILTSMVKKTDAVVYDLIKAQLEGTFTGENLSLGVSEDAVGLSESTNINTPKEVIEVVEKAVEMIKNGELTIPSNRKELINFKPVEIK